MPNIVPLFQPAPVNERQQVAERHEIGKLIDGRTSHTFELNSHGDETGRLGFD